MSDDGNVGLEMVEVVQPWLPQLQQSAGVLVGYVDAIAESDTLRPYRHVPLSRRRAELALFYLWWIDKYIRGKVSDPERAEGCAIVFHALVSEDIREMDDHGEDRFRMFSMMEDDGAAVNVYAVVPMKAMDPTIEDVDRINALVIFLAEMTKELDDIWG